jgi:hypothetical protein
MVSEQWTAVCAVSGARKQMTYAFVSWRVSDHPGVIAWLPFPKRRVLTLTFYWKHYILT